MANIMERITNIMESNIHALLDKCENPEKMLDQTMRNALEDLAELKESAIKLNANERAAKRKYDAALQKMQAEHGYAANAMRAGDEAAAARFLQSEAKIKALEVDPAKKNLDAASANYATVKDAYNKLASDIDFMRNQMDAIKSTMKTAKATERVAAMKDPSAGYAESFGKYADKAQRMLDEANAKIEMNTEPADDLGDLREKYAGGMPVDMSDALAALKEECMPGAHGNADVRSALDALKSETGVS